MCLCSDCGSLLRSAQGVSLHDFHRSSEETSQLNFSYCSTSTPCLSMARCVAATCAMKSVCWPSVFTCFSEVLMHIKVNVCTFLGEWRSNSAALCTWQNSTRPMLMQSLNSTIFLQTRIKGSDTDNFPCYWLLQTMVGQGPEPEYGYFVLPVVLGTLFSCWFPSAEGRKLHSSDMESAKTGLRKKKNI